MVVDTRGKLDLLISIDSLSLIAMATCSGFIDGMMDGQGCLKFSNGDTYCGSYKHGSKNGKGTFTYSNGDSYVGDFVDDNESGFGVLTYAEGDKYEG
jgi:hypothetical protein